ncbi:hypothetical protein NECAME_12224 [Necator americanus]|uniref:Uncharacterized protein n=1 Tax=Necator americanus TaxID=51031 RepID=W2T335_NECAM|nr:hypothetical protein NECAME_12224 [Necator americanus]ETN75651.1 hypothetical protein NECAME_12224 [Necator americanus]
MTTVHIAYGMTANDHDATHSLRGLTALVRIALNKKHRLAVELGIDITVRNGFALVDRTCRSNFYKLKYPPIALIYDTLGKFLIMLPNWKIIASSAFTPSIVRAGIARGPSAKDTQLKN